MTAFLAFLVGVLPIILPGCKAKEPGSDRPTVVLWHWMTDRDAALQKLGAAYEKASGHRVRIELYAPTESYTTKVRAAAQTGTLPDIFSVLTEPRDLASFINAGHIANLQGALDENKGEWRRQFFPRALANSAFVVGNQYGVPPGQYGIPIDVSNIQMLYNKDLFAKAGLDPAKPPRTWPEFMDSLRALKRAGVAGLVVGWGEVWLIDCFSTVYALNVMGEQKLLDTYRGRVKYTDPDWLSVLQIFDDLRREGVLASGVVTMLNKSAEQVFASQQAAYTFNGSWSVNVFQGMSPNLRYGVLLPPAFTGRHPMRIWGGAGSTFMVNAKSQRQAEAVAFLRWLSAPEQQTVLAKETMNLPASRAGASALPPVLAQFAARMNVTTHPSQWPVHEEPGVAEVFLKGIQSIVIGEQTPQEVAAATQAAKDRLSR